MSLTSEVFTVEKAVEAFDDATRTFLGATIDNLYRGVRKLFGYLPAHVLGELNLLELLDSLKDTVTDPQRPRDRFIEACFERTLA